MFKPSPQQEAIFDAFASGEGHIVIDARAGCGKTTTVVVGIDRAPERSILMCAFNKVIADVLKERIKNPNATSRTLHSLGNGIVFKRWGKVSIDERRGRRLAAAAIDVKNPPREAIDLVFKLAAAGKNVAPFASVSDLVDIAEDFDLVPANDDLGQDETPWTVEMVARCAHRAMEMATVRDGFIDFDDMIFLPVRCRWVRPQFDMVVVDECQDMNATQIMLARGVCRGRLVVVGDPHQAIYGFRGADSDSMARLERELSAKRLGLTTTYRCPKAVVRLAQELVPDFQAAPEAPEGTVRRLASGKVNDEVMPGDFVLSRKNAPLARICLSLLRAGKRAVIRGKDIGKTLAKIVTQREETTIPGLIKVLVEWERNVVDKLLAEDAPEARIELVQDQVATICGLAEGLATTAELLARLESLFSDNNIGSAVICSTIHKAKGLESERVYLLVDTLYPGRNRDSKREEEERNIHYVGLTRAKNELVLVKGIGA